MGDVVSDPNSPALDPHMNQSYLVSIGSEGPLNKNIFLIYFDFSFFMGGGVGANYH